MNRNTPPVGETLDLISVLILAQILIIMVTAIEALVIGAFAGALGVGIITALAGGLTALAYRGSIRKSNRSRKWLLRFQKWWIAVGVVDLLLAIFLARRGLEIVPLLTRFVLPLALIRLLRRPEVLEAMLPANPKRETVTEDSYVVA